MAADALDVWAGGCCVARQIHGVGGRHCLGFQRDAVLFDYVIDAEGLTRYLLVATKHL